MCVTHEKHCSQIVFVVPKLEGDTKHPVVEGLYPGGSSSGSAAIVGGDVVHDAIGTDTGGSIRHPAAVCGRTGLKPTFGRTSN
ncbi:MAG: hypothetical protein F6K24_46400, partial [Okeania sp. SIO2D1]|nr:hypothetical protein [Okeania sp. SIO2D1]